MPLVALTVGLVFGLITTARAAQPPYLNEMPSPERVMPEILGKNDLDTAARRAGAFYQLKDMIGVMSEGRNHRSQLTRDEMRFLSSYADAERLILNPTLNSFDAEETRRLQMRSPRAKWYGLYTSYQLDTDLREYLLIRFFSPAWRASYLAAQSREAKQYAASQRQPAASKEVPGSTKAFFGFLMIIAACGLFFWVGKRQFYRRNVAGVEEFKSYGAAVASNLLEGGAGLLAIVLVLIGVFMVGALWP